MADSMTAAGGQSTSVSKRDGKSSFQGTSSRLGGTNTGSGGSPNQGQLTAAAADFLQLGKLDFDPTLDFIATNRVVAVLQKAVERLQLLTLLDTTEPSTFSAAKANEVAKHAETDNIASRMIGTKRTGLTRSACLFAGPQGRALQKTTTAVTNAILAATNTQHRGRPTVAEMLFQQRQLEIRYGDLLKATRKVRPRATDPIIDPSCFTSVKDPEYASLQHELKIVSAKLREHNKILFTQLKDNMNDGDNWVKVSNERQELIALLQGTIAELCTGYDESRVGRTAALKGSSPLPGCSTTHSLPPTLSMTVSNMNATSLFAATLASKTHGELEGVSKGAPGAPATSSVASTKEAADPVPLMKRFGSTMHLKRAKGTANIGPRMPLTSSYESISRKILREQAAQRWADELVRKERELNQNVKQLQSDLLLEKSLKDKDIEERRAIIEDLRLQLRALRHRLNERSEEAKEQVEAATEGLQRQAAEEDRIVTEEMVGHQQQLEIENKTYQLFAEHLKERASAMDKLSAEWEKKNQVEIKAVESRKIDAEQARQQTAEKLHEYEQDMTVQKELDKQRNEEIEAEEAGIVSGEERRQLEHISASQIESAIKAMFTRNALIKLKKKARKKR